MGKDITKILKNGLIIEKDKVVGCNLEGSGKEKIVIPNKVNGIKIKAIEKNALSNSNHKEIIFPKYLEVIKEGACEDSLLRKIVFQHNLKKIEKKAFAVNHMEEIIISDNVIIHKTAFKNNFGEFRKTYYKNDKKGGKYKTKFRNMNVYRWERV